MKGTEVMRWFWLDMALRREMQMDFIVKVGNGCGEHVLKDKGGGGRCA